MSVSRSSTWRAVVVAGLLTTTAAASGTAALAAPAGGPATPEVSDTPAVSERYVVTLAEDVAVDTVAKEQAKRHGAQLGHLYRHAMRGYAARMSPHAAARLAQDPRVLAVEPDAVVTTADHVAVTAGLPTGIDRVDAELSHTAAIGTGRVLDVDVAVLDTGIAAHADMQVAGGYNCTSRTRSAFSDGNGHGTHVAGTIAAEDDGAGVVGVAPGARLWAVKVLSDSGSGFQSDVICGVDWVTGRKDIEVANMSLSGSGTDPNDGVVGDCRTKNAYHDAICRSVGAGTTYVVAAGNNAADASSRVPAAYDEVITVSALADFNGQPGGAAAPTCRTDEDDTFANFSNYGHDVDLIAPGVCITSTWLAGGLHTISGTSMAAPHVAGAAALYKVKHPLAQPAEVRTALRNSGQLDWDNSDDRDADKEPLVHAAAL